MLVECRVQKKEFETLLGLIQKHLDLSALIREGREKVKSSSLDNNAVKDQPKETGKSKSIRSKGKNAAGSDASASIPAMKRIPSTISNGIHKMASIICYSYLI